MDILLDTNVLLFGITNDRRLGITARALMSDPANRCFFSSISVWEVAIKHEKRPADVPVDAATFYSLCQMSGATELPLHAPQTLLLAHLIRPENASRHNGPFDRMLLCQAKSRGMMFITCDSLLLDYPEPCLIDGRQ